MLLNKKIFILVLSLMSSYSYASVNTLSLVDEYDNGDGKVCVYSNGDRTETLEKSGAGSCPSKHTFH